MKITVCVKQSANGDLSPFDASAYEAALRIAPSEVTLLSMAPKRSEAFLSELTRRGAREAVLLCDAAFAGADTLATAYTLSLAVRQLQPDLILCGRQSMDGDTAQTGPGLSAAVGYSLITGAMNLFFQGEELFCETRSGETLPVTLPAVVTVERFCSLRLPSFRSKTAPVRLLDARALSADLSRCGQKGSPTRVMKTEENEEGKRRCHFVEKEEFARLIRSGLERKKNLSLPKTDGKKMREMVVVGEKPAEMAATVAESVRIVPMDSPEKLTELFRAEKPAAVLWGSDSLSKKTAALVAWNLQTGLCADCTRLQTDGENLFMFRPAFMGNIVAEIRSDRRPQMATVRTGGDDRAELIFSVGLGAEQDLPKIRRMAERFGAELAASRAAVDRELLPYECQVGLTGKSVNPSVYVAFGISGAVHHIEGMKTAGTVIAVNRDQKAPIFDYADYGIVCDIEELPEEFSTL